VSRASPIACATRASRRATASVSSAGNISGRKKTTIIKAGFFVPAAYVQMFRRIVGAGGRLVDATAVLMHPESGFARDHRRRSDRRLRMGFDALLAGAVAHRWGRARGRQRIRRRSAHGLCGRPAQRAHDVRLHGAGGAIVGLRSPTGRRLRRGDGVTTAVGFWGALSSRAGLLDIGNEDFLKRAGGYFAALAAWYDVADIGVTGGDLHAAVVDRLAAARTRIPAQPGASDGP